MKKLFLSGWLSLLTLVLLFFPIKISAQENPEPIPHFRGKVTRVLQETTIDQGGQQFYLQQLEILRYDTKQTVVINAGSEFQPLNQNQLLRAGKIVILAEQPMSTGEIEIVIVDVYRAPSMLFLFGAFVVAVIIVAKWQGLLSLLGMGSSLIILGSFIVPQILAGQNPILVSLIGSLGIAGITMYLSHGWSLKSHLALASMLATLFIVALMSQSAVQASQLVGLGSEEAYFLQFGETGKINLQGLLLGGIILGALGVLDDIAVSQVSVVFQLRALKKDIDFHDLYTRALSVGKDHVASLVNTLVLAYAGANLPLFILFIINDQIPHWVTLNSEVIVEEVIRTLTGSIGLVLAVPLTTILASYFAIKIPSSKISHSKSAHAH